MTTKRLFIAAIYLALADLSALGGTSASNHWGAITNDVRMSIRLEGADLNIRTNQPVTLLICITNASANATIRFRSQNRVEDDPTYSVSVISPSGNDIALSTSGIFHGRGSGIAVSVGPGQARSFVFNVSRFCRFQELGAYRVTITKMVMSSETHGPFVVTSNPLSISVVPGRWEGPSSMAPRAAADAAAPLKWGPITNGMRMSIRYEGRPRDIKTNEPLVLVIRFENVTDDKAYSSYQAVGISTNPLNSVLYTVTTPSGKSLAPKRGEWSADGSGKFIMVRPKQSEEILCTPSPIFHFNEIGVYTIVAEKAFVPVGGRTNSFLVRSNPLSVSVVPGEWKTQSGAGKGF